jgi:hypothetical protein
MSEDTEKKDTVPPPPGAADPYSADTRVGEAPAALLAMVREAEQVKSTVPRSSDEPKPTPETQKMSDDKSEKTAGEPAKPPKSTPPPPKPADAKAAAAAAPKAAAPKPAKAADPPPEAPSSPASAIITLFVLIAAALALATR